MAYSIHCGIDLGSKQTQIAIIDDDQQVLSMFALRTISQPSVHISSLIEVDRTRM
jgi:activator of 2-hydroxyglutaryl-CoA dehydratase